MTSGFWEVLSDVTGVVVPISTSAALGAISIAVLILAPGLQNVGLRKGHYDSEKALERARLFMIVLAVATISFLVASLIGLASIAFNNSVLSIATWGITVSALMLTISSVTLLLPIILHNNEK